MYAMEKILISVNVVGGGFCIIDDGINHNVVS